LSAAPITTFQKLNSVDQNLARVRIQYPGFVDFTIRKILTENIVDVIKRKMKNIGLSDKIIDATFLSSEKLKTPSRVVYSVISNYNADTPNGDKFPVAVFIEDGRRAYVVEAPPPTEDRPRPHLGPIKQDGNTFWLKKAKIPRYVGKKFVRDTIKEQLPFVQGIWNDAQNEWITNILKT